MSLSPGTRLGPYEILAPLGRGGMGEVYRARDTRLGRDVAVKVLPAALSANPELRARFEREARTISSLNHPNICTLYDVGREGDTDYLVMELLEGETLTARLTRGALPSPELLRVAVQVADALDRAHRSGVVHRDLKPGNIMLTRSGAKLMDFGLARTAGLVPHAGGSRAQELTQSPTLAQPLTAEGSIVGTFQYMAPEQLEGGEADARSDVWALGCVLYEMATGRRAFEGRSQASLIAAVMGGEPRPIAELADDPAAPGLERLIRACLAKDADDRVQTAHDVKLQLKWIAEGAGTPVSTASGMVPAPSLPVLRARRAARVGWLVAAALLALGGTWLAAWNLGRADQPRSNVRFEVPTPQGQVDASWPRLSPDGRTLMFVAQDSSHATRCFLRPLDQAEAHPIPGSEGVTRAYWSPDGREIVFAQSGKLERLPVTGGTPTVICESPNTYDLSWGAHGDILVDGRPMDSLRVVPAAGGDLRPATTVDRAHGEIGTAWACFLPDGRHFLYKGVTGLGSSAGNMHLGRLGSLAAPILGHSDGRVEFAPPDWVLFVRGTTLMAQRLDVRAARLVGQPVPIVPDLRIGGESGNFSASPAGPLAFEQGAGGSDVELALLDRSGHRVGASTPLGNASHPVLSPDGARVLFSRRDAITGLDDIWVFDRARGTLARLTFGPGNSVDAAWSPDGRRFTFTRSGTPGGIGRLMLASSDGAGSAVSLKASAPSSFASQWVEPGPGIVYTNVLSPTSMRIEALRPDGSGEAQVLTPGSAGGFAGAISPDGRWLAYASVETGRPEVFVRGLGAAGGKWQVSNQGGLVSHWTKGGREIVFEDPAGEMFAVPVQPGTTFASGTPQPLFRLPIAMIGPEEQWSVSPDGQRFVAMAPAAFRQANAMQVVTDFGALVARK